MDGNGRWANARGLPRVEGHRAGEDALVEVVAGAAEIGLPWLSVYAFSTENWRRSPGEVRFLMGYSRRVLRERRDLFHSWGVRVIWSGEQRRLWPSVVRELREAEALTRDNTGTVLNLCVNYGGRAEIADAARALARQAAIGQ
jgi:undecaprenyl diphosphate synthase